MTGTTTDPVTERGKQLDDAHAAYLTRYDEAWGDYRAQERDNRAALQKRLDGLIAEYEATVDRIRAGE
jgi:hypothetical protein